MTRKRNSFGNFVNPCLLSLLNNDTSFQFLEQCTILTINMILFSTWFVCSDDDDDDDDNDDDYDDNDDNNKKITILHISFHCSSTCIFINLFWIVDNFLLCSAGFLPDTGPCIFCLTKISVDPILWDQGAHKKTFVIHSVNGLMI